MIADVVPSSERPGAHGLAGARPLVTGARFDQAFTPRWAPDNRHVAYSSWRRGGYRDVRIVDTADGSFVEVTHDRAIDGDPVFSADGRWLFFHSDRTGVTNVYAYEVGRGRLKQVTNVVSGAYQPEPSADGRSLAYVGYTHAGFDVFVMALDEAAWLDPLPYEESRPEGPAMPPPQGVAPRAYNPLPTLQPRRYSVQITPGNFGQASIVTATGGDIAGLHALAASLTTEWEQPDLQGSLGYTYARLPFDMSVSVFRQITPQTNYQLGSNTLRWIQEQVGVTTGIRYAMPRAFDGQAFSLSYSFLRFAGNLPLPISQLNPYDTPRLPSRGSLGTLHLGWAYSNAQSYLWSVGNESGFGIGVSFNLADPVLASDVSGYAAALNLATYLKMPWAQHHTIGLHGGAGAAGGGRAGSGQFYVGGFVDLPVLDVVQNYLVQGGVVLRGYPVVAQAGNYYALANAEYRFPILNVDRGPSTLPFFLDRISGAAFVDYGSAFDTVAHFKTGVGGELWFDLTLGYVLGLTFRAGYARGLASGGLDKPYFVAAVAF